MCDRRRRRGAALALAVLLAPAAVAAQTPEATGAELEAARVRLDSLLALKAAADRAVAIEDSVARERAERNPSVRLDTVRVGPLTVVTRADASARVGAAFSTAWSRLSDVVGGATAPLASTTYLVEYGDRVREFSPYVGRPGYSRVWLPRLRSSAWLARAAETALGQTLAAALPDSLRAWLGDQPIGAASPGAAAYRGLALSPAPSAHRCLAGDVPACVDALGLSGVAPDWGAWYGPEQRRAIVRGFARPRRVDLDLYDDCVRGGGDAACLGYLERHAAPPPALPAAVRAGFLDFALGRAAPDGYGRLLGVALDAAPAAAVARATGEPIERVAREWRRRALAARPHSLAGLGGGLLLTVFWLAVFAAFAMRSTRWRLG